MLEAPILFVCENNLFSSHMHISQRQPTPSTARFALANKIKYEIVDGNNLLEVENAANRLISYSRKGNGPTFLEAITYRQLGHVDWRSDTDVGLERSATDLLSWKLRDPISRLVVGLVRIGFCSPNEIDEFSKLIESEIETAWNQAIEDPYPEANDLLKNVYSSQNMEH
jgi:pyruvate dehydrogenase E1 component alpha subunit